MMKVGMADKIVFSTAYATWEKEAELKKALAVEYGIPNSLVEIIPAVTQTFDEARSSRTLFLIQTLRLSSPARSIMQKGC